jgi:sulfonate transport system permease protein
MTQEATSARESSGQALPSAGLATRGVRFPLGLVLPILFGVLLEVGARYGFTEARLAPPPSRIWATFQELLLSGEWFRHALATGLRVGAGFFIGAGAGIVLGAASGALPGFRRLIDPTVQALRAVPSIAWVPLFILWLGIFEASKITLIAVGVFFPVYLGVLGAILSVERKVLEVGRIFRLSRLELARRIMLPATLPALVTSLRAGLGLGWMFVVAAEIMGASEGLGFLLVDGQQVGRPDLIVTAIISFALLGFLSDVALSALSRPFLRWRDDLSTSEGK